MEPRPADRVGLRGAFAVLATLALVAGTLAASAPASDAGSPAEVAKKKCKKKGAGAAKKKCKRKRKQVPVIPPATPTPTPASLSINPTSHNFGNLTFPGGTASKIFTVTNSGGSPSGALTTAIPTTAMSDSFSISENACAGVPLAAFTSCTLKVTFTAPPGSRSATLNVSGVPGGNLSASLSGSGSP